MVGGKNQLFWSAVICLDEQQIVLQTGLLPIHSAIFTTHTVKQEHYLVQVVPNDYMDYLSGSEAYVTRGFPRDRDAAATCAITGLLLQYLRGMSQVSMFMQLNPHYFRANTEKKMSIQPKIFVKILTGTEEERDTLGRTFALSLWQTRRSFNQSTAGPFRWLCPLPSCVRLPEGK